MDGLFYLGRQMADGYKPTSAMVSAAKRGLKMREEQPPSNRGGTDVGIARARDIISGKELPLDTVKRMYSFFSRHEVDKSSASWKKGNSKGEQAWLMWGGDAGYRWSKSIVEREKKSKGENNMLRVNLLSQINSEQIRIDRTVEDGQPIAYIRNHNFLKDGIVLNGGLYDATENEKGFKSMEGRLFTYKHPMVNGEYVSISNQDNNISNKALESHYMFASNVNVRKSGSDYFKDIRVNTALAKSTPGGAKLVEWIESAERFHKEGGTKPTCINTSTGLMCNREELTGNSRGKNYTWRAANQCYDHDAFLDGIAGAGGDEIALSVNGEECPVMTVNLSDAEAPKEDFMFLPVDEPEANKQSFLTKIANKLGIGVKFNGTNISTHEENEMKLSANQKQLMLNAIAKTGEDAAAWEDQEILDRFMSLNEEDEDDEEDDDEGKKMPKNKKDKEMKGNSFTLEDVQNLLKEERKSIIAEMQTNSEKGEKEAIVNGLIANAAYSEASRDDLMNTPLSVLKGFSANQRAHGIAPGYQTNAAQDDTGLLSAKLEG